MSPFTIEFSECQNDPTSEFRSVCWSHSFQALGDPRASAAAIASPTEESVLRFCPGQPPCTQVRQVRQVRQVLQRVHQAKRLYLTGAHATELNTAQRNGPTQNGPSCRVRLYRQRDRQHAKSNFQCKAHGSSAV